MPELASPWIDDELAMLQDQTERFVQRELVPHIERWERDGSVDRDAWLKAGAAGLLCAGISSDYGGGGGTRAHEAVIQQEIVRAGVSSFAAGNSVSCTIVAHYLSRYGTEEQKQRWLPRMARGELIGAIAMTEPGSGSDLQSIRTRGITVQGGYLLSGQKTFITNGRNADLVIVVARTGNAAGGKGLSLLVVEGSSEGFRRGRTLEKLGLHGQDTAELFFDDVFVADENLLGQEGQGFRHLMEELVWERLIVALEAVINMERAVALTTGYVRERTVFGQKLIDFQNTQFVLADCAAEATVARVFIDGLMVQLLAGELDAVTAAKAKLWTTETQCKVIDRCQQLFGGYGYMSEYPIARLFTDARAARIYAGANEIMKLIIARSL